MITICVLVAAISIRSEKSDLALLHQQTAKIRKFSTTCSCLSPSTSRAGKSWWRGGGGTGRCTYWVSWIYCTRKNRERSASVVYIEGLPGGSYRASSDVPIHIFKTQWVKLQATLNPRTADSSLLISSPSRNQSCGKSWLEKVFWRPEVQYVGNL